MIIYRVVSDTDTRTKMNDRCRTLSERIAGRRIQWIGTMDSKVWDMTELERLAGGRILLEREDRSRADDIAMISGRADCDGIEVTKIITERSDGRPKDYILAIYHGYAIHVATRRYMWTPRDYGHQAPE